MCDVTLSVYPHGAGLKNMPGPGRVAQLAEHWASIAKVVGSNPTAARHIFQAFPVWIYTQSNITQASYSPEYITPTQKISLLLDYTDIEGTRLSSEISHTRTGLTA